MKVLIFAAGLGSRLKLKTPKILVKVGEKSILSRHIDSLSELGIVPADITVVIGYKAEEVKRACLALGITTLFNPSWQNPGTFSSFSVFPVVNDSLLIIHGDLVWETGLAGSILEIEGDVVIPVDPRRWDDDEAMKVEIHQGKAIQLSKELPISKSAGESMGMFLLNKHNSLYNISSDFNDNPNSTFDDLINFASSQLDVKAFVTDEYNWEEIDTPADLTCAKVRFS